jgi:phosphoribosylformylglycinamidine synthase
VDSLTTLLYAESAGRLLVTVPRDNVRQFQNLFTEQSGCALGFDAAMIGNVSSTGGLVLTSNDSVVLDAPVDELARAFKKTLDW